MSSPVVPVDSAVYYSGAYWNDLPAVVEHLHTRMSGHADRTWMHRTLEHRGAPYRAALSLNVGNGWVERDLVRLGVVESAHGIEYLPDLVEAARSAAAEEGLPITYEQADTNRAEFHRGPFDLVVDHAALHHVAHIDRVVRGLCERLEPGGTLVGFDYVGPHRNQYPWEVWEAAHQVNLLLPEHLRQEMTYPHLPTMLVDDPTEAVHSELIEETVRRYFEVEQWEDLGGAIAYLLLTHNARLHARPHDETDEWVRLVLDHDRVFTAAHPEHNLFAFFLARPRHDVLAETEQLATWSAEEERREAAAGDAGSYYPPTSLQLLTQALSDERDRVRALEQSEPTSPAVRGVKAAARQLAGALVRSARHRIGELRRRG
ncbi:class I SAM-dependent methyltransferase [Actinomarinicola tropica]|uniref:Methyltransferase domain-containing protein n=1 Tax=Actinomarinicola tropica TaxID=2789776 RepID=A0A5Q2RJ58_9ACTN|nr:class I SAM-dependent methyltransferase [Actinomarinicola tropica]QGG96809.1 methyltransferase domain-containing protein [Actinomarinicola tropica]